VASVDCHIDPNSDTSPDTLDDGNTWLDAPHQLDPDVARAERSMFTLGGRSDIDITSPFLRDILSESESRNDK
jgi:hypothetical protein